MRKINNQKKGEKAMHQGIKIEVTGLDEFKEAGREVIKKAEELQEAIQRLNDTHIELKTELLGN